MTEYSVKDGRIWMQKSRLQPYGLLLPYGMTDVTDPAGSLNAVREAHPTRRRETVITDILRGEPSLPGFSIETKLMEVKNVMMGLKGRKVSMQAHLGHCDRADNYASSKLALVWESAERGDLSLDRLSMAAGGDNATIKSSVPFQAQVGPVLIDFGASFLSAFPIADIGDAVAVAALPEPCGITPPDWEMGEIAYLATGATGGSPVETSRIFWTQTAGAAWSLLATAPFAAGESVSTMALSGEKYGHRIIVARGTTDPSAPAEIAYADVDVLGTVTWVNVDVGAVNGQTITDISWESHGHVFAATEDGYVYRSKDAGASWELMISTLGGNISAISSTLRGVVWAAGDAALLYMSEDWGESWSAVTPPQVTIDITACAIANLGTDEYIVYVGYADGTLWGTATQGRSWQALPLQGVVPTAVTSIETVGGSVVWVGVTLGDTSGRVLRSTDGGAQFALWSLGLPENSGISDIAVVDYNMIYACGAAHNTATFATRTNSDVIGLRSF